MKEQLIDSAVNYAWGFIKTPYKWGGENPIEGYDCSGFVQEVLRSVGLDPRGDQTAHALYYSYSRKHYSDPQAGALAFFGTEKKIIHVGFCINEHQMIEAGGGGSRVRNHSDAEMFNAFIRLRPIKHRSDLHRIVMPEY